MRLRRLVETKSSGKCHVPPEVVADYKSGGELREWLEIALLESLKKNWNITAVFQPHEGQVPSMKQHACANFYMGISATTHTHTGRLQASLQDRKGTNAPEGEGGEG